LAEEFEVEMAGREE
jgi:chromosome segregation ATPase